MIKDNKRWNLKKKSQLWFLNWIKVRKIKKFDE